MTAGTAIPPGKAPPLPRDAAAVAGLLLAFAATFCVLLWPQWRHNPDLSHGLFAPVIFLLLIWESRTRGAPRWIPPGAASTAGTAIAATLGLAAFALAGIFAASLAWSHALVCTLLAAALACFLLAGLFVLADARRKIVPLNCISLTAVFSWILASPLPDGTYARLTLALQGWVTGAVMHSLQLLGVPARQHGNIIELATATVGVEEACSGIRSLVSCLYAGFFFAAWQLRRPARRLLLIAVAPLLALGMNFLRSLTLTLLANSGRDIAGFWHDATGYGILGLTALILAGLAILLESGHSAPNPAAAPEPGTPRAALRWFWSVVAVTLVVGCFYVVSSRRAPPVLDRPAPDLAGFLPGQFPGWEVRTPTDLYRFSEILQTSNLLERTYLRPDEKGMLVQFTVYLAYWAPGQAPVSRVASHTPDACWPGSGWEAVSSPESEAPRLDGIPIAPGEYRVFRNPSGFAQNVWFWHVYDGRVINYRNPYSIPALFQLAVRYGFRRQGDQYFVRVSSNRPWADLESDPLVRKVFDNLSRIGL